MSGVPEIDLQHQELVSIVNKLNDAVKNNAPRKDIYMLIAEVISFTRFHFAAEERLMAEAGYPELEAHKNKHKLLIEEALHLREKLDHVGESMFTEWFNHWPFANILAHIQYADQQVEDYIVQSRLKK